MNSGEGQLRPHSSQADQDPSGPTHPAHASAHDLARELTGDLPCIACSYNLRSISVLGVCPECGTPVRATILARVDPYAGVLRPISLPRTCAFGLMLWSIAAFCALLAVWIIRATDVVEVLNHTNINSTRFIVIGAVMVVLSGTGAALSLVRPHSGIPRWQILLALVAVAAYIPLLMMYWQIHVVYDASRVRPFIEASVPDVSRAMLRLAAGLLMLIIIAGLRPNLRLLTARSLLLRMGRVDRQTSLGLAGAIGITLVGDLIHIVGGGLSQQLASAAFLLGLVLIAVGTMLVTLGVIGVVIDCLRIIPVVVRPPISYRQVLGAKAASDQNIPEHP